MSTVPIMTQETHLNVLSAQEWLNRLKLFLQSQGWTIVRHLENVQWTSGSGFISGTEFFLEVFSNGYGNQNLHLRFRLRDSSFSSTKQIRIHVGYGDTDLDNTSNTHPVDRFKKDGVFGNPISGSDDIDDIVSALTIPTLHFFGFEQKYCCIVSVLDTQNVGYLEFGTYQVEDNNTTFGCFSSGRGVNDWQTNDRDNVLDLLQFASFRMPDNNPPGNNAVIKSMGLANNQSPHADQLGQGSFMIGRRDLVIRNQYSEFRGSARDEIWVEDPVDGVYFSFAESFYLRTHVNELPIGHTFTLGTENYICFPNYNVDQSKIGVAFRIS